MRVLKQLPRAPSRWRYPFVSRLAAFFSCKAGAALSEFVMIFPIIVAMIGGGAQVAIVYLAKTEMQLIAQNGARAVLTRQAAGLSADLFKQMICDEPPKIDCSLLKLSLSSINACAAASSSPVVTYDASGAISNAFSFDTGQPGDLMLLQLYYSFRVFGSTLFGVDPQATGRILLVSTQIFPNEP